MNKKIIVRQNGYKDCGASCLLSIMRYYGLDASHEEVSYILKTSIDGTTAYDIINGSKNFGFDGYGLHYSYEEIINNKITFPIICHVLKENMYHFIVVYKVKKNKLIIMDPKHKFSYLSSKKYRKNKQSYRFIIIDTTIFKNNKKRNNIYGIIFSSNRIIRSNIKLLYIDMYRHNFTKF